jgi:hypothetical protein
LTDLTFHLFPTVFLLFDSLLLSPPSTLHILTFTLLSSAFALLYALWLERCYSQNGFYPYPLLEHLSPVGKAVLFATCALVVSSTGSLAAWLYEWLNGQGRRETYHAVNAVTKGANGNINSDSGEMKMS